MQNMQEKEVLACTHKVDVLYMHMFVKWSTG